MHIYKIIFFLLTVNNTLLSSIGTCIIIIFFLNFCFILFIDEHSIRRPIRMYVYMCVWGGMIINYKYNDILHIIFRYDVSSIVRVCCTRLVGESLFCVSNYLSINLSIRQSSSYFVVSFVPSVNL